MNSNSLTFFLLCAIIFLQCLSSTRAAKCHPDDEAGLLAFKSSIIRDPSGTLSSWKKGTFCCSWYGVICISDDRVTELYVDGDSYLGQGFLFGTISPMLAKLQHLEGIYLTSLRKITGTFPQFLFQLPKLKYVSIQGSLLSGSLPANIGELSQLEKLIIDGNRFTGQIPSSISNLTRLSWLNLGNNRLSGAIPNIFKSMRKLQSLDLSQNNFSGKLPPSIASLALTLTILNLGQNNLSGTIPNYLSRFEALSTLVLSRNRYSGVVPMSFVNLTNITNLDLSHNLLTGPFPSLKSIDGIETLDLSYNQFHLKTIPKWVTSSPFIYSLKLAKCGIKMSLDDWKLAGAYYFVSIDLSENEMIGSPVRFLNQMKDLMEFRVRGNKLQFDLGKLKFGHTLKILDLSRNLIFGKVPATVVELKTLNVSQNHLCGKLPATKFPASAFTGNYCLCGSPLSPCKV
ncbi:hypothetical protein CARUB_v10011436mg [Capsella rubella]|uniref:Leucine-rich repeat-containing N-terminal plant-type domain-containing protein n=1 Tax=Capsella rubella TaxID=81985 RepID=R0GPI3_9BRAS|nr:leucine-rich repeat receptor-like protein kinase PXC2 [Capsella rubella]EOA37847.1 hypothetical protein CARUB_v10011436mg [Capsella rubella]